MGRFNLGFFLTALSPTSRIWSYQPPIIPLFSGSGRKPPSALFVIFHKNLLIAPRCFHKRGVFSHPLEDAFWYQILVLFMRQGKFEKYALLWNTIFGALGRNRYLEPCAYPLQTAAIRYNFIQHTRTYHPLNPGSTAASVPSPSLLLNKILKFKPIFRFIVQRTNKYVWKYSRGRAGRYKLLWRFVLPHKRPFILFRWLFKEFKFDGALTLTQKAQNQINKVLWDFRSSNLWQLFKFIHNHVLRKYRTGLMVTYLKS